MSPTNPALLLTDTYPNRKREQSLLVLHKVTGEPTVLARERIPLRFRGETRCDFHPRWSPDGPMICFDSAGSGTRALVLLPAPGSI